MKPLLPALSAVVLLSAAVSVRAADNVLDQLATCQVSWLDMKEDPAKARPFAEALNAGYERKANDGSWAPHKATTMLGLPVVKLFPESVGMAVGFSVTVDAPFEKARDVVEKASGK